MIRTWKYKEKDYHSDWSVRQAIFEAERKAFSETPMENLAEFWKEHGVEYTETPEPPLSPEEQERKELEEAKRIRAIKVKNITVQVGDKVFDGNEEAQSRMTRALKAAEISGMTETQWVLANNDVVTVTKEELEDALEQSMLAMSLLWVEPYTAQKDTEVVEKEPETV